MNSPRQITRPPSPGGRWTGVGRTVTKTTCILLTSHRPLPTAHAARSCWQRVVVIGCQRPRRLCPLRTLRRPGHPLNAAPLCIRRRPTAPSRAAEIRPAMFFISTEAGCLQQWESATKFHTDPGRPQWISSSGFARLRKFDRRARPAF